MKKLRIYFDTSVINFLFADDAPEKKDITIEYFEKYVKNQVYDHYISDIVIAEIDRTKEVVTREKLISAINEYNLTNLPTEPLEEIEDLAEHYIKSGIIPERKIDDALHVAICTVHQIDILLSWNFRHLANINKERKILVTNIEAGYNFTPRLTNPMEVFNDL